MTAPRPLREYCECGAGITLVGHDDDFDLDLLSQWREHHADHERVSAGEASAIRHQYRARR